MCFFIFHILLSCPLPLLWTAFRLRSFSFYLFFMQFCLARILLVVTIPAEHFPPGGPVPCHPSTFAPLPQRMRLPCWPFTAPMCCTPPSPLSTMCPPFRNSPVGWKPPCAPTPIWWQSRQGELLGYAYAAPFHVRAAYQWAAESTIYLRQDQRGNGLGPSSTGPWNGCWPPKTSSTATPASPFLRQKTPPSPRPASAFTSGWGTLWWGSFIRWGYKFDRWYHMVWMEKALGAHTVPPAPFLPFPQIAEQVCPAGQRYDKTFSRRRWSRG